MCDTFIIKEKGMIFFGKNSDREPNEAQLLEHYPPREFKKGEKIKTTYLEIEQKNRTNGIIISRPFWMWGAEMGVNDKGVVIGNEAVFTKMPYRKKGVLTGMDILRLALERGSSAEDSVDIIISLINDYGQGGICGLEDKRMAYHNSFLIADKRKGFVLETAGKFWVYKEVKDFHAISNRLTIGESFDNIHPETIDFVRKKGWLKKGKNFNFGKIFSDYLFTKFSGSKPRLSRAIKLLKDKKDDFSLKDAFSILRDHGEGDYNPDSHFTGDYICAHAGNFITRKATQTVNSFVVKNQKDKIDIWSTATSSPCTAIFNPISFKYFPNFGDKADSRFNNNIFWWQHELLYREALRDFSNRILVFKDEITEIENRLVKKMGKSDFTENSEFYSDNIRFSAEKYKEWYNLIKERKPHRRAKFIFRSFWNRQNKKARLNIKL